MNGGNEISSGVVEGEEPELEERIIARGWRGQGEDGKVKGKAKTPFFFTVSFSNSSS